MRYPASEKLEIIHLVERSHLPVQRTLDKLGIPTTTFYRWYDRYRAFNEAGLEDRNCGAFVDTYRTMCTVPNPEFERLLREPLGVWAQRVGETGSSAV